MTDFAAIATTLSSTARDTDWDEGYNYAKTRAQQTIRALKP